MHFDRAGELTPQEVEKIQTILENPLEFKIPKWFLNRQKDITDGSFSQLYANQLDIKLRNDIIRLKKIRYVSGCHRWVAVELRSFELRASNYR